MSRRKCNRIQRLISDELDCQLSGEAQTQVRVHLAECAECAAFERAIRSVEAELSTLPYVPGNPAVRDRVLAAAYRDSHTWPHGRRSLAQRSAQLLGSALIVALVAVVLIAVFGGVAGGNEGLGTSSFGSDANGAPPYGTTDPRSTPELPAGWDEKPAVIPTPTVALHQGSVLEEANPTVDPGGCLVADVAVIAEAAEDGDGVWVHVSAAVEGIGCDHGANVYVAIIDDEGNPLVSGTNTVAIDLSRGPVGEVGTTFLWTNWCGNEQQPAIIVNAVGHGMRISPDVLPACVNADDPSTLTIVEL